MTFFKILFFKHILKPNLGLNIIKEEEPLVYNLLKKHDYLFELPKRNLQTRKKYDETTIY